MHIHLVNFQVVNRQLFNDQVTRYVPYGDLIPPEPNELGWKETVHDVSRHGNPGHHEVRPFKTQIKRADGKTVHTPPSPRTGGAEYVWHCHILEHEEHDMMHALVVK